MIKRFWQLWQSDNIASYLQMIDTQGFNKITGMMAGARGFIKETVKNEMSLRCLSILSEMFITQERKREETDSVCLQNLDQLGAEI